MAKIDDIGEMLKTVINNLSTFKQEVFKRFDEMDEKFDGKIDGAEARLTKRIDAIGMQLAFLEEDAPTTPHAIIRING